MRILIVFCVLWPLIISAQTTLQASKSGGVTLTWSGGTGPYNVSKSTDPRMSADLTQLANGTPSTTYTDAGTANDGNLQFYNVSDVSAGVTITITGPTNGSSTPADSVTVSGTVSSPGLAVSVNTVPATVGGIGFTASGVRLTLGPNTITATASDGAGNIAAQTIIVMRTPDNPPPAVNSISPSDGSTICDATPEITITYCDDNGIDASNVRIYLDSVQLTPITAASNANCASPSTATYQIPDTDRLTPGTHTISATVHDTPNCDVTENCGYSTLLASTFLLEAPHIDTVTPGDGIIATTITVDGCGFDPTTPSNDTIDFNGVTATATTATETSLTVDVPTGATSGPLTVLVAGYRSNPVTFLVDAATGFTRLSHIVYKADAIPANDRIYAADTGSAVVSNNLFSVNPADGTKPAVGAGIANIRGLPVSSDDFVYYSNASRSTANQGSIERFAIPSGPESFFAAAGTASTDPVACVALGISPHSNSNVFFADRRNGQIRRVRSAAKSTYATGFSFPDSDYNPTNVAAYGGMVFNNNGGSCATDFGDLYVASGVGTGVIKKVEQGANKCTIPDSTTVTDFATGFGQLAQMVLDDLGDILATDFTGGKIWRVPVADPAQKTVLAEGLTSPRSIAFVNQGGTRRIYVGLQTSIIQLPPPTITITGDQSKVYANFDPVSAMDTPNVQYVVLTATLAPLNSLPPGSKAVWTFEVPDDPNDDTTIDPNGATGNDNNGTLDGSPQWTQEGIIHIDQR